jgi:hypothetical protein
MGGRLLPARPGHPRRAGGDQTRRGGLSPVPAPARWLRNGAPGCQLPGAGGVIVMHATRLPALPAFPGSVAVRAASWMTTEPGGRSVKPKGTWACELPRPAASVDTSSQTSFWGLAKAGSTDGFCGQLDVVGLDPRHPPGRGDGIARVIAPRPAVHPGRRCSGPRPTRRLPPVVSWPRSPAPSTVAG